MERLFLLPGGLRRDPGVEAWLASRAPELGTMAWAWFERIRACGDDVRELMHDGAATACVDDAAFAYVAVFMAHVNVGFFYGMALEDPAGLLEGSGKRMRHVKLRPGDEVDSTALGALIEAAHTDIRRRLDATR